MIYNKPEHKQFVEECEEAGLEVRYYQGRCFWKGPAVACEDLQEVIRATQVSVQWDNLGLGWIVYPVVSDSSLGDGEVY